VSDARWHVYVLAAAALSYAAAHLLDRYGQGWGLVVCWWLFLIPAYLFVGIVIGQWLRLPAAIRYALTASTAAVASYFLVI
jgi:hypothetical protein